MKNIVFIFILLSLSCFHDDSCETWIDSTRNKTWTSDSTTIEFYQEGGVLNSADTTYEFMSYEKNDSFYLYKVSTLEKWVHSRIEMKPLSSLDRMLVGTDLTLQCHSAFVTQNNTRITFDIR